MIQAKLFKPRRIIEFVFGFVPALGLFLLSLWGTCVSLIYGILIAQSQLLPFFLIAIAGLSSSAALIVSIMRDTRVKRKQVYIALLVLGLIVSTISVSFINQSDSAPTWNEIEIIIMIAITSVCLVTIEQIYRLSMGVRV